MTINGLNIKKIVNNELNDIPSNNKANSKLVVYRLPNKLLLSYTITLQNIQYNWLESRYPLAPIRSFESNDPINSNSTLGC
jgi:hypothetical protein